MNHPFIRGAGGGEGGADRKNGSAGRGTPPDFQTPLREAFMIVERSDAAGLALFHCAPAKATHRSSLGVARDSPHGLFSCGCVCVHARESTAVYVR